MQLPDAFLRVVAGIELPPAGEYGVGMLFLPRSEAHRKICEARIAHYVEAEGQRLLGWRDVPVDNRGLGETVKVSEPVVRQVFIGRGSNCADQNAFERKLFVVRKQIENEVRKGRSTPRRPASVHACGGCRRCNAPTIPGAR